ncbi:helix-turn-helix transcriptional regulator [Fodinicola acaciae]|uniref:helix-turn-helix transcriptional regulator n=1 Tax=Fodinicola acaciae TaxID=2681555 RepID=UPI001FE3B24B|nr:helix-turn-helix transcriptional regulator [Fodinicola acaciae]
MDTPDLSGFLQSRRALADPARVGSPGGSRRRVRGLRREEVARLAGISVEYYVRLEQGRATKPSDQVLDALAGALELDDIERAHLHDLAAPLRRRQPRVPRSVRPQLGQLVSAMTDVVALVLTHRFDVLAWNHLATQAILDFHDMPPKDRNLARLLFLHPVARERYVDWDEVAASTVGALRFTAARHPDDELLAALVGELSVKSQPFRELWAVRHVTVRTHGRKRLFHPLVGQLTLNYENFAVPGDADQQLLTLHADPGSTDETNLRLLGSWSDQR